MILLIEQVISGNYVKILTVLTQLNKGVKDVLKYLACIYSTML